MRHFILMFGLLLSLLVTGAVSPGHAAVELKELYQYRVQVNSQLASERTEALQEALRATLLKLTGDTDMLDHPAVADAMRNVRDYLVQYGYQQDEQLWLWAQFDQPQIDRLIQRADSGIWSNLRPQLLVWLVAEDEDLQRQVFAADSEAIIVQQMRNAAARRGLPIQLPLLDLNDTITVSVIDIWARFMDTISFASTRYSPDGIIVARIYQTDPSMVTATQPERWSGDWTLNLGELRWSGQVRAMDRSELGAEVIREVTEQLAERYRIGGQTETINQWTVTVENLTSLEATIAAEQLLAQLPAVLKVQLVGYGNATGRFDLTLQTDPARIRQAMDLSKQLQAVSAAEDTQPDASSAVFRWIAQP
ncbi:DUF2066 domain-containing protein [Pseudidiomarina insulisalsae]|nr:DUF2066 domain-containing protein [Pseudidiomarina insulisalsae]